MKSPGCGAFIEHTTPLLTWVWPWPTARICCIPSSSLQPTDRNPGLCRLGADSRCCSHHQEHHHHHRSFEHPLGSSFVQYRFLHPLAWILERLISTPATHQRTRCHHGRRRWTLQRQLRQHVLPVGRHVWNRSYFAQYPAHYGISHYEGDPWYSQLLWPLLKSNFPGSELAVDGPVIHEDVPIPQRTIPGAEPLLPSPKERTNTSAINFG